MQVDVFLLQGTGGTGFGYETPLRVVVEHAVASCAAFTHALALAADLIGADADDAAGLGHAPACVVGEGVDALADDAAVGVVGVGFVGGADDL